MTQKYLDMFKIKVSTVYPYNTHLWDAILIRFTLWWAVSSHTPFVFGKYTESPKKTLTCSRSKITNMHVKTHRGPNFRPFHSTISRFWVMGQFSEKCTEWPQMILTCSRSKIPTCKLHTPPGPKFSSISRYDEELLSYGSTFGKYTEWPQMTLTCSRSKIPTCMLHTPLGPKFSFVYLYNEPFLSYGPIFGKVHRTTPNDFNMFKVKNTNMHVTYTPETQIFLCFVLRWVVFLVTAQFSEKCTEWPQMTLTCSR